MRKHVLVAFREKEADRRCILAEEEKAYTIGRAPDADMPLPDSTVSRHHATVRTVQDKVIVEDASSTNGIFLNGEPVKYSVMREGDFLTLGAYTLVMRTLAETEVAQVPAGQTLFVGNGTGKGLHHAFLKRRSAEYFPVLYKITLLLGEHHHIDELLREVLALVVETLPAVRGAVVIQEDEYSPLRLAASISPDNASNDCFLSKTLAGYVMRNRTVILTENAQEDPRFSNSASGLRDSIGAAVCAPLCGARDALGVLYVDAGKQASCYGEKELEFITAIAKVLGIAVENRLQRERIIHDERLTAMGNAIAGICHDVRNMLTGIVTGTEQLENACAKSDMSRIERISGLIRKSSRQVEGYLSNLLMFARERKIQRKPAYVRGLVEDTVDMLRPYASEHAVELVVQGAGYESAMIDAPQMERVLHNMLRNGIESCAPKRGGSVTVSIASRGDSLLLDISDTGTGIPPEDIPHLSEPFFTRKGRTGTGLGLAVSFSIVEQHGGKITVYSEVGRGTVFSVAVPEAYVTTRAMPKLELDGPFSEATIEH